jgi:hypothetical protein
MATGTVDQIAERQFGWMRNSREFQESRPLYLAMLRELAKGKPVAVDRLVEATGQPVEQATPGIRTHAGRVDPPALLASKATLVLGMRAGRQGGAR